MTYGDIDVIGVQLELVAIFGIIKCGMCNFIIDEQLIPGKGTLVGFYPTLEGMRDSLDYGLAKKMPDIGAIPIEQLDFSGETPQGFIAFDAAQLYDFGFCFWLGFDGDEDRFLYSTDYEKSIQEKRYPRGTIEKLIRSLPTVEEIEFCSKEAIKISGRLFVLPGDETGKEPEAMVLRGCHGGYLDALANEWQWLELPREGEPEDAAGKVLLSHKWRREYGWPSKDLTINQTPLKIDEASVTISKRVAFYHEIEIIEGKTQADAHQPYRGRKGVILGISEAEGVVHAYGIYFRDGKVDELVTFAADEVSPTGFYFQREEFYDGSYAYADSNGELLRLHVAGSQRWEEGQ